MKDAPLDIALEIEAAWDRVPIVRAMVMSAVDAVTGDAALSESVGMVASELVENAVRYGSWPTDGARRIGFRARGTDEAIEIVVASPVLKGGDRLERFEGTLKWIRRFATPAEAYVARVSELAEGPLTGGSRMGLVRIAAEARSHLDAEVDDASVLHVRATVQRGASR